MQCVNTITMKDFIKLMEVVKNLKSSVIYFDQNYIVGIDYADDNYLTPYSRKKILMLTPMFTYAAYLLNDLKRILSSDSDDVKIYTHTIISGNITIEGLNPTMQYVINEGLQYINDLKQIPPTISVPNIREMKEFEDILSMKSAEGAAIINIHNKLLTLFPGLIPVNKDDKVDLYIRDIDMNSFMSEFVIHKHKGKYDISQYVIYRVIQ